MYGYNEKREKFLVRVPLECRRCGKTLKRFTEAWKVGSVNKLFNIDRTVYYCIPCGEHLRLKEITR